VDGGGLGVCGVQEKGQEADADVEDFAGDLVLVDLDVQLAMKFVEMC
jgi:hypothetical protein